MTQTSFPKGVASEKPLGEDQWKNLFLSMGRGIVDMGGTPYWLSNRDSVTDTVTIGVDSIHGYNIALLDGFMHYMDAPETLSVPPVAVETVYEIGLVFDFEQVNTEQGPITLTVWKDPEDTSSGRSYLTLWRITRKPNVALGSSTSEEVRPRNSSVIMVTRKSDLPTDSLVLSDTLAGVRQEGKLYRSAVSSGQVQWIEMMGGIDGSTAADAGKAVVRLSDGTARAKTPDGAQFHTDTLVNIGWVNENIPDIDAYATPGTGIKRWDSGVGGYVENPDAPKAIANKQYVDGKTWDASRITTGSIEPARVVGSVRAYQNTNLGSTWTSVAVNSSGMLGRYPSALKYKKNIREWNPDPQTILDMTPVQYDVRTDVAGASEDSDKGLIGFVADSYVETRRELVLVQDGDVEGFHYHLMPVAQQVVLRWQEKRIKALEDENDVLKHNLTEVLALLGLNTDAEGRVITTDTGSEA